MIKSKEIPEYYIGKKHKIEARKVIEDFQGDNYNLGTAITYLLRAGKKEGNPTEQDRIYTESNIKTGGLAT